jgi:hypothetical protein
MCNIDMESLLKNTEADLWEAIKQANYLAS